MEWNMMSGMYGIEEMPLLINSVILCIDFALTGLTDNNLNQIMGRMPHANDHALSGL